MYRAEMRNKEGKKREGVGVSIDKWVCSVSRGSGEHRQLGQHSQRGTGKWGFYLPNTKDKMRANKTK